MINVTQKLGTGLTKAEAWSDVEALHACGIIANQIGKLGDPVGLNAFKNEGHDQVRLLQ